MKTKKKKWVITILTLCCSCGFLSLFYSCEQSDDDILLKRAEENLNLIAPSGERIADDVVTLKKKVADFISERYGIDKDFEIKGLQYLPLSDGYSVLVDYKTEDGIVSNLGITSNNCSKVKFEADEISARTIKRNVGLKTRREVDGGDAEVTYSCKASSTSSDKCECKLTVFYHEDTGVYEYSCDGTGEKCTCNLEFTYG